MKEEKDHNIENNQNNNLENKQEMTPQIIGELPTEKQGSVIWVFIFFALLCGFTFGLPYLREYVESKKSVPVSSDTKEKSKEKTDITEAEKDIVYYEIDQNVTFVFNNLRFNNLVKESTDDYYFVFSMTNESDNIFDFSKNYYVEFYTADKTLLERSKIVGDQSITNNQEAVIKLQINENTYNNASLIAVVEKSEDDYPEVTLNKKDNDYDILVCTNKNNEITYFFKEDKLEKITDIYNYTNVDVNSYNAVLSSYQNLAASYNNVEGVVSNITDTNQSFTMNTQIDLATANVDNLKNKHYFKKNANSKKVKFEMEAMRYTCS